MNNLGVPSSAKAVKKYISMLDLGIEAGSKKDTVAKIVAETAIPSARVVNALLVMKRTTARYSPNFMNTAIVVTVVMRHTAKMFCSIGGVKLPYRRARAMYIAMGTAAIS